MRRSITAPDLTASSGLDVTVVSSSSVSPEPARASRERPKDIEDVILVKFVLLVSVHTTSVNETRVSEASKFQVLLCLNVLQRVVLMESSTQMLGADTEIARLSCICSPALASRLCGSEGVIMVFLILSVHSGKDSLNVSFSSMIRFSLTAAVRDVMDSRDR